MSDVVVSKLSVEVSAYEMPETEKVDRLVKALVADDAGTGMVATGYGVYALSSSGSYGIMF